MKKVVSVFVLVGFFLSGYSQSRVDSLLRVWENSHEHDTVRLNAMTDIGWNLYKRKPDTAIYYAGLLLEYAEKKHQSDFVFEAMQIHAMSLVRKNQLEEALALHQKSVTQSRESGNKQNEGIALGNIAEVYKRQDKYEEALNYHAQALQLRNSIKDSSGIATTLNYIGVAYKQKGDLDSAKTYYLRSLEIKKSLGDQDGSASSMYNLGLIAKDRGNYAEAIKYFNKSLNLWEELGNDRSLRYALNAIGNVYRGQDENDKALEYYNRSLAICEATNNKSGAATSYNNMSLVYKNNGELETANSYLRKSLRIKEELNNRFGIGIALVNLGSNYHQMGKGDSAVNYYNSALSLFVELGAKEGVARSKNGLALSLMSQGKYQEVIDLATDALLIGQKMDDAQVVEEAAKTLYKAYKRIGDKDNGLLMYELYIATRDSMDSEKNQREVMRFEYKYVYEKEALTDSLEFSKKEAVLQERTEKQRIGLFAAGGGLLLVLALAFSIYSGKKKSDELLLNILPYETAQELKKKGHADAKLIDEVTVLFTDFKGFTAMAEQMSAKNLVEDLNICFSEFDRIMEKHGIEKIKTIGDAYMAAGGLPVPNSTHAHDVVKAAFEMRDFVEAGKARKIERGLPYFEIRIGVHTGPVVAGIVGVKKYSYDIWGDTVNTASRMESSGEVGKVNLSETTYDLVKDDFLTMPRGEIAAKGKGMIKMFFVDRA